MNINSFKDLTNKIQKENKIENLGQSISIVFDIERNQFDDYYEYKKLDFYEDGTIQVRQFGRNDKKNYKEMILVFTTDNKTFTQMYQFYCILTNRGF